MAGRISYYGNIVRDGLVLHLDAAKRDSYPGSGAAWNDISGFRNNGVLVNSPTFNAANGGYLSFDGTNQYVNVSSLTSYLRNISNFSYSSVLRITGNNVGMFFSYGSGFNYANDITFYYDTSNAFFLQVNNGGDGGAWVSYGSNDWLHLTVVYDGTQTGNANRLKFYINGDLQTLTFGYTVPATTSTVPFSNSWIGAYSTNDSGYLAFDTSIFKIYNRSLSPVEVLQNYNAVKGRYL
jgi:hypothetical protein